MSNRADEYEERLADELRKVGVVPGRNPDGVNDDPEKAGLVMREALERVDATQAAFDRLLAADERKLKALERIGGELVRRNMNMRPEDVQALWALVMEGMDASASHEDHRSTSPADVARADRETYEKPKPEEGSAT